MALTVLVNAGPWLPVPPRGYGGIEQVVASLVPELRRRGVGVVLATVGDSTVEADERVWCFAEGQFRHLAGDYPDVVGIAHAHMQHVVAAIRQHAEIDVVHDHLEVVGPATLSLLGPSAPPVLQTLHWDLRKHPDFYSRFDGRGRVFFNAVSPSQLRHAPASIQRLSLGAVPLGVPLDAYPFEADKDGFFLTLGRVTWNKGCDTAARLCKELGVPLRIAGPVGGLPTARALWEQLADVSSPFHHYADVQYYLQSVRHYEQGDDIHWVGSVDGAAKQHLLGRARALLMPIRWDEPGGTVVVEALASGTPVVGMRRGVLPLLIDDGVNGFLADDERGFAAAMLRVAEIDPAQCRRTAEEKFSSGLMAERYLGLYEQVIREAASPTPAGWKAATR